MIYLDYSATTPVNKEVLKSFDDVCLNFIGNPNSLHKLGVESKNLIDSATNQIARILKVKNEEIIYTSGSSESNNLAIKGICERYKNRGNHIITTSFEHSSIYGPIGYLQKQGFEVDFVDVDEYGIVNLDHLKSLIRDTTILVSVGAVNSEIGIKQPIEEIGKFLKEYPKCFFHVDMTQAVGKIDISLENVGLASFSAHKIYGLKGVGILVKKQDISLIPIIHGGKSTTIFRSGTPATPLIVSISKALRMSSENLSDNYKYVSDLNNYLKDKLKSIEDIYINSNEHSIPHILNISIPNIKPETMLHALEESDIYISTQTACSSNTTMSKAVLALTKDETRASSSLRISLSHLTTKSELDIFVEVLKKSINKLKIR